MKNSPLTVVFALYFLAIVGLGLYQFRYELGLKKPSFEVGMCFELDLSSEFEPYVVTETVRQVGKTKYQTVVFGRNGKYHQGYLGTSNIEFIDSRAKRISCPPLKEVLGE